MPPMGGQQQVAEASAVTTWLWHTPRVEESLAELRAATSRYRAALKRVEETRSAQRAAIRSAIDAGVKQVDVARITGYNREHVRRILLGE